MAENQNQQNNQKNQKTEDINQLKKVRREKLADLQGAPAAMERLFSIESYMRRINGKQEVMIG